MNIKYVYPDSFCQWRWLTIMTLPRLCCCINFANKGYSWLVFPVSIRVFNTQVGITPKQWEIRFCQLAGRFVRSLVNLMSSYCKKYNKTHSWWHYSNRQLFQQVINSTKSTQGQKDKKQNSFHSVSVHSLCFLFDTLFLFCSFPWRKTFIGTSMSKIASEGEPLFLPWESSLFFSLSNSLAR